MSTAARGDEGQIDRLARAREALSAAERSASRWGGRIDRTALRAVPARSGRGSGEAPAALSGPTGLVPPPSPSGDAEVAEEEGGAGREGTAVPGSAAARSTATLSTAPLSTAPLSTAEDLAHQHGRFPVPAALAPLIPQGTLRAGSSVAVTGDADCSLLLALAVAAMGEDSWCAVAGMPDLGIGSLLDAGADPDRLALVPGTSVADLPQLPQILSALVDGVGVVVLGPDLVMTPALWRTLTSRARTRDALVLAVSPPDRSDLLLSVHGMRWLGLGNGSGRLRGRRVQVTSTGRGIAGSRDLEILLPDVRGALSPAPSAQPVRTRVLRPLRTAV